MNAVRIFGAAFFFFALVVVGTAGTDTAKKLVGVWEITKSKSAPPGATLEFTKDGKMIMRAKVKDKEIKIDGTYELKDKKITATLTAGGKTKSETATITKISDKEMTIEDEKGEVEEYKRSK